MPIAKIISFVSCHTTDIRVSVCSLSPPSSGPSNYVANTKIAHSAALSWRPLVSRRLSVAAETIQVQVLVLTEHLTE